MVTIEGRLVLQVFRLVVDKVNITRYLVSIYLISKKYILGSGGRFDKYIRLPFFWGRIGHKHFTTFHNISTDQNSTDQKSFQICKGRQDAIGCHCTAYYYLIFEAFLVCGFAVHVLVVLLLPSSRYVLDLNTCTCT